MDLNQHKFLRDREKSYFWNVGRREILESILSGFLRNEDNLIADIGCGPGGNISSLKKFGSVTGVDISKETLEFAKDKGFDKLICADIKDLPMKDESFDVVSSLDVLEHIDDDVRAVSEMYRILKPGGILLITVPAFQSLFTNHDRAMGHFRRYREKELTTLIEKAGFTSLRSSYFVMPGVLFHASRKLFEAKDDKSPLNADPKLPVFISNILLWWLRFEKKVLNHIDLPFGTSIFLVGQKPFR